ncbi:MAG: phytanoyl-CoA dioxygenase family protein [Gammaproteobacteria bacterium]|nr:MAG: phytanoyl-CoA dioxygenase family protein [Gammaproteobacteria bacterium]
MVFSRAEIELFQQRGFLVKPAFFPTDTVRRVGLWLEEMSRTTEPRGSEARYYEKSPVSGRNLLVRMEHFLGPDYPGITELLMTPATLAAASELLGEPAYLFKEKVNFKLPGCRADKLHQDQSAGWNAYCDFFLTMAIAVDDNRRDNAALTFLQSGNYQRSLMAPEWKPLTESDPPYSPPEEYCLIEANAGDAIFFDSYVPHGSPPNTSQRARRNIYITFNRRSAGDLRHRYYQDKWASYPPNRPADARSDSAYRV